MYYTERELTEMEITFGENVRIHRTVLFFGNNIDIGSNVRIDCYSVITSGKPVILGNYIHMGAGVHVFGTEGVKMDDYSGLSSRCSIFTSTEDYVEGYMTNPTVPDSFKKVFAAPVHLKKHVILGCGSIVMPGVTLKEGVSVGAMSFVNKDARPYTIIAGTPAREIGKRNKEQLSKMEKALLSSKYSGPFGSAC